MSTPVENGSADASSATSTINPDTPFRVLGVALVVDQRGSGARLVARYPTQPSERSSKWKEPEHDADQLPAPATGGLYTDDDLFFSLTARQMVKLFRTKKTLCGNPMTLAINATIFCCRAVLMQGEDGHDDATQTTAGTDTPHDNIVLFSVIVAMSAPTSFKSVTFSTGSWLETATEDQLDIQRYVKESTAAASIPEAEHRNKGSRGRVSSSFLSIRRVHISLARYCRVLEREEKRCNYISLQSKNLFRIRNEHQKIWEERKATVASAKANKQGGTTASSSASVMTIKSTQSSSERRPRHIRSTSFIASAGGEDLHTQARQQDFSAEEEQEKEQEILELMLAAMPPQPGSGIPKHYGNLARELVQLFHSLSRNDSMYPPTATSLLIERDAIVHVNQHVAIPIEAAAPKPSSAVHNPTVRPYYTLLFPHASPASLLHALQSSGSAPPQRLQQLLLTVNAQKPMTEIALDANLPLYTTLEMASYLVTHGACVMSPIVSRQSRLVCHEVERIPELTLDFSQLFGNVHLFRAVGFLTSVKTLGAAMSLLTDIERREGAWLRECLMSSRYRHNLNSPMGFTAKELSPKGNGVGQPTQSQDIPSHRKEEMEEQLYAMAVWLISHRILAQLQEYFAVVGPDHNDIALFTDASVTPVLATASGHSDADENLFRELLESNFLNGDVSVMALSWRLGLDQQKVRSWGLRHGRIRVVSRIPKPGDDWDW